MRQRKKIMSSTHNGSKKPEYRVWATMKDRCSREKNNQYSNYGGRGIAVCEKWKSFAGFYEDMGERPGGYQLDRIDNDKGYEKANCRWASASTNSANRRNKKGRHLAGVYVRPNGKITAKIRIEKITYYIGACASEKEAHEKYIEMFKEWYGQMPAMEKSI